MVSVGWNSRAVERRDLLSWPGAQPLEPIAVALSARCDKARKLGIPLFDFRPNYYAATALKVSNTVAPRARVPQKVLNRMP